MANLKETNSDINTDLIGSNLKVKFFKLSNLHPSFKSLLLFFLIISNSLFAQISFDVKTTMGEKQQLHIIKIAVINALKLSDWARVTEVREDYSLWLTNLLRSSIGNSLVSSVDLDLRTPAMISRGKHINGVHVSIEFDTTGISNVNI